MGRSLISVVVQGVPERGAAWHRSMASLLGSDIGKSFRLMLQPSKKTIGEHFLSTLRAALEAPTEYTLRLEDDAIVNRFILHNIETWLAKGEKDFGAGWLFSPVLDSGKWYRREIHGSVGVLLKKSVMPQIIERAEKDFVDKPDRTDQDLVLSRAVRDSGLYVYIHYPSLVEHPIDVPSTLGHQHTAAAGTSSGRFSSTWMRQIGGPPRPSSSRAR